MNFGANANIQSVIPFSIQNEIQQPRVADEALTIIVSAAASMGTFLGLRKFP